jgi:hypothetical protein
MPILWRGGLTSLRFRINRSLFITIQLIETAIVFIGMIGLSAATTWMASKNTIQGGSSCSCGIVSQACRCHTFGRLMTFTYDLFS